ncbi:MAG: acyl carrier protein [Proteobacteria bacterium]|nr:acyl carrier protein [Pseudomonadota bacterium]
MVNIEQAKEKIAELVCRHAGISAISNDERYFDSGLVTSMFALQIVMFVEKEFGLTLDDDDLNIQNFASIDAIAQFVGDKSKPAEVA